MTDYSEKIDTQINLEIGLLLCIPNVIDVPDYCNDWASCYLMISEAW